MNFTAPNLVSRTGATQGCVLIGVGHNNKGFRIRVLQTQPRGDDGPIKGCFRVIGLGDNKYSKALEGVLGQMTDAEKLLRIIRQEHRACVSNVNANLLIVEETSSTVP